VGGRRQRGRDGRALRRQHLERRRHTYPAIGPDQLGDAPRRRCHLGDQRARSRGGQRRIRRTALERVELEQSPRRNTVELRERTSDIKAFSAADAWAVGRIAPTFNGLTLVEHWQGSSWTQVASPSPGTRDNTLSGIAGSAPTDVWAVGYSRDLPYGNRARHSLILHYDGSAWSRVPSPDVDTQTVLNGVVALSTTNAWAVGYASNQGAVVMHFDGHSWTATTLPQLSSLTAIVALSASDIWAAGFDAAGNVALAWRGSSWDDHPGASPAGPGLAVADRAHRADVLDRPRRGFGVGQHQRHRPPDGHPHRERLSLDQLARRWFRTVVKQITS
jgi:hypothetical protein